MSSAKTQPARGMRDFLPADVRKREYVIGVIKEVYERYGFEPLETPAVENIETLLGKYGEEGNQLIFKILKRGEHEKTGEADLALRYDLTVPLARVVAQYQNELPKFFKRYQIQPVWRADRPARGRFREFYQCDVDVLGSKSMVVEAELIAAASDALVALGFNDFVIRINHRSLLQGVLEHSLIPTDKYGECLATLDKLEKIGVDGVDQELASRGISDNSRELLLRFVEASRDISPSLIKSNLASWNETVIGSLTNLVGNRPAAQLGLNQISEILRFNSKNIGSARVQVDPTLARGLSYYTGAILEAGVEGIGSLGGGGRYDDLVGMFLGKDVPACGFSLGLERIIVVMSERGMFPKELISSPADFMVAIWNEDSVDESIALANELRAKGLRVDLYPEADKLAKQFKYASSRGIPFVLIVGDDERASDEVTVRNMESRKQLRLPFEELKTFPEEKVGPHDDQPAPSKGAGLLRWLRKETEPATD